MRSRFIARPRGVETLVGPLLSLVPLKPDIWNRTSFVMFTATASSSLSGFPLLGEGIGVSNSGQFSHVFGSSQSKRKLWCEFDPVICTTGHLFFFL
ncbi:hypothetical protein TNIN_280941 [Trichonephila inaurata madagascariensis]|uniref:Uncharacterized protein n=1 Tax=Trichonephila inaurata madagascariensis TaxID=2747483 RepID=A0A8X6Y6T8_9ARAC|nr:hypothetical protein TNIN_280941 [Trichonephila inaurata madagascariensis]